MNNDESFSDLESEISALREQEDVGFYIEQIIRLRKDLKNNAHKFSENKSFELLPKGVKFNNYKITLMEEGVHIIDSSSQEEGEYSEDSSGDLTLLKEAYASLKGFISDMLQKYNQEQKDAALKLAQEIEDF